MEITNQQTIKKGEKIMIDGKLVKIIENLHSDINELYYGVDGGKISEQELIRSLGSTLNHGIKQLSKMKYKTHNDIDIYTGGTCYQGEIIVSYE